MRIMECIGRVTLSRCHPSLQGGAWKILVPLTHRGLCGHSDGREEPLVAWDDRGAREGDRLAVTESAEAAAPFHPEVKPVDAYNAAILDSVNITPVD